MISMTPVSQTFNSMASFSPDGESMHLNISGYDLYSDMKIRSLIHNLLSAAFIFNLCFILAIGNTNKYLSFSMVCFFYQMYKYISIYIIFIIKKYTGTPCFPVTVNSSACFSEVTTGSKKMPYTAGARLPIYYIYILILVTLLHSAIDTCLTVYRHLKTVVNPLSTRYITNNQTLIKP